MSANSFNEGTVEMNSDNWSDSVGSDVSFPGSVHAAIPKISSWSLQKKKKKPSTAEKRRLATFIKEERTLWDQSQTHYSDKRANDKAWERIAKKMPGRTSMFFSSAVHTAVYNNEPMFVAANDLRVMWKSLRDSVRYRKNKMANGEPADADWEFKDCLEFLMDREAIHTRTRRFKYTK